MLRRAVMEAGRSEASFQLGKVHSVAGGWLGGRRFRVLMTRLPITEFPAKFDGAAVARPDQTTLADDRAPPWVATEAEALVQAFGTVLSR